ncbi:hypothetical protein O6H91_05G108700 [Diphasiastrum complanatum]|uniref:Uncharacterized protein n=1 Tax=Diphasiastrum complanatum TaxID=34168 RepID=A0ACC2DS57_DIPCM|nr:hypothetical protein O6H91_05G108700 [Diphasiastrum complanatum]
MVVVADPFPQWTDFPRGLQVLLVGKDIAHNNDVRFSLERCHYIVTTLGRDEDAIAALENFEISFHLVLVEATQDDELDGFKILKAAGNVPTIMMTATDDMTIIMQGIALGAVDFLQKPVTKEKLRNIWQHVVRKALNSGNQNSQESVKLLKDSADCLCESMHRADFEAEGSKTQDAYGHSVRNANNDKTLQAAKVPDGEKLPTPLRPQAEQLAKESSHEDMPHVSPMSVISSEVKLEFEEISREVVASTQDSLYSDIKFEDYTCSKVEFDDSLDDICISSGMILDGDEGADTEINPNIFLGLPDSDSDSALDFNFDLLDCSQFQDAEEEEEDFSVSDLVKLEEDSFEIDMLDSFLQSPPHSEVRKDKKVDQINAERKEKNVKSASGRKKIKKYRSHRKNYLYRESRASNWRNGRSSDLRDRNSLLPSRKSNLAPIQPRLPVAVYPGHFPRAPLHVWGHPSMDHSSAHLWHQTHMNAPTTWHSSDATIWQHPVKVSLPPILPTIPVGVPVIPGEEESMLDYPADSGESEISVGVGGATLDKPCILHPSKEVVDAVINEALNNPIMPLPLGLKPPSMESVIAELQKQGINGVGMFPS